MAPCKSCTGSSLNNANQQLQQSGYLSASPSVAGTNAFCAFCAFYGSLRALNGFVYGKCSKNVIIANSIVQGPDVLNRTDGWCDQFKKK